MVQVREAVEDPVEAVEPPLAGPRVLGAGGVGVGVLGQVPLAGHERGPARVPVDLRRGRGVLGQLHGVAGEARVAVGDVADAGPMAVQAGEQGRPGRRAHGGDVEVRVPDPPGGEGVDVGGPDLRAVAAEIRVAEVVDEDDEDVGRVGRRLGRGGHHGFRPRHRPPDPPLEPCIRVSHTCSAPRRRLRRLGHSFGAAPLRCDSVGICRQAWCFTARRPPCPSGRGW